MFMLVLCPAPSPIHRQNNRRATKIGHHVGFSFEIKCTLHKKMTQLSKKSGLPPATFVYTGTHTTADTRIAIIDYNPVYIHEVMVQTPQDCAAYSQETSVTWINIDGIANTQVVVELSNIFALHPLIIEDILDTNHRPKAEEFDNYIFFTLKTIDYNPKKLYLDIEQVSFAMGKGYLLSFQEVTGDAFEPLRQRIRQSKGFVRQRGADYLTYRLLDTIVDSYFVILDAIGSQIEILEEKIIHNPNTQTLRTIQQHKKNLTTLAKHIAPLREAVGTLQNSNAMLIKPAQKAYFKDLHDHILQAIDTIHSHRELLAGITDTYMSNINNNMNVVMKMLALISTIFMPLSFIAGVYGMNFDAMPELHTKYGYYITLGIMAVAAAGMLAYFRWRRWL
jgi:magnesium transporter